MDKRIVIRLASGLHKILGHMDVTATDQYPPRFDNVHLDAERTGSVIHAATKPHYILYREWVEPNPGQFNDFHPSQT